MFIQTARRVATTAPAPEELEKVLEKAVKLYPKTRVPWYFRGDRSRLTRANVLEEIKFTNPDSGPGLPWNAMAASKGELLKNHKELFVDAVMDRIDLLASRDLRGLRAQELVQGGFCDPVRIFVKNEPHKVEKLRDGRVRLICSVSAVDEVVEKLLFGIQNSAESDRYDTIPSQPGNGFSTDDQVLKFIERIGSGEVAETDMSGYDWSLQEWMLELDLVRRLRLAEGSSGIFKRIAANRVYCLINAVLASSDGNMFVVKIPGIQLSGSNNTSSTNSAIRWMCAMLIGAGWAVAMGDDALEDPQDDIPAKYKRLGLNVKFVRVAKADFEFCSKRFRDGQAEPLGWAKSLYNLLGQKWKVGLQEAFELEYRHSPHLEKCRRVIAGSGWARQS